MIELLAIAFHGVVDVPSLDGGGSALANTPSAGAKQEALDKLGLLAKKWRK
jgi:hypothetical protein